VLINAALGVADREIAAVAMENERRRQAYAAAASDQKCLPGGLRDLMPLIAVAHLEFDGSTVTVEAQQLSDWLADETPYAVTIGRMSQVEFDRLPEFAGF
jgi:hypothetical protein